MRKRNDHSVQSGEAGYQGHDRQPGKDLERGNETAPGPKDSASGRQVKSRSRQAQRKPSVAGADQLHPDTGTGRPRLPHVD